MNTDRNDAIDTLTNHHYYQKYRPENQYSNVVNANGNYLGPYIPYIGKYYFNTKPRLLIYAMAQNLSRGERFIESWLNSPDRGMRRQYHDTNATHIHVYPYDNGHLKVIAAIALNSYQDNNYKTNDNIGDLIAITNFVKFSFYHQGKRENRRDRNPPKDIYDLMWELYCKYEISVLQPDIIIGVGNEVTSAITRNLKTNKQSEIIIIKIPFPGRLNLNSRWIPKGKNLIRTKNYDPNIDMTEMQALLKGTPDKKGRLHRAIQTDWYYFREMKLCIAEKMRT